MLTFLFWFHFSFSKVLVEDLFGEAAKEREVEKIANKLPEAKTCKSFDSFEILAKFAGTPSLTVLISPLKEVGVDKHDISARRETYLLWHMSSLQELSGSAVFVLKLLSKVTCGHVAMPMRRSVSADFT